MMQNIINFILNNIIDILLYPLHFEYIDEDYEYIEDY